MILWQVLQLPKWYIFLIFRYDFLLCKETYFLGITLFLENIKKQKNLEQYL